LRHCHVGCCSLLLLLRVLLQGRRSTGGDGDDEVFQQPDGQRFPAGWTERFVLGVVQDEK
jgi:hypothetical protein